MEDDGLTAEERRGLDALLPADQRGKDVDANLLAAARESLRRREQNSLDGGAVLDALRRRGWSLRKIEKETGIPFNTIKRWADKTPLALDPVDLQ